MDRKTYVEEATLTCSNQFHGELVPLRMLTGEVIKSSRQLEVLDIIKKSLFYGKPNNFGFMQNYDDPDCAGAVVAGQKPIDIIHGILGIATEAGELLEALQQPTIDDVNIKEELGDIFWYCAVLAKACGFTFEEVMDTNIGKLRKRFPNNFTEYDANNRDLAGERAVLEGGA